MSLPLQSRKSRHCPVCGDEGGNCKPEGHMGPERGVTLGWNPEASIGMEGVTIPPFEEGTVRGRFTKQEASILEPTVKTKRTRKMKTTKEQMNVGGTQGSEPREQGRGRGSRRRTKREVEGPGSVG